MEATKLALDWKRDEAVLGNDHLAEYIAIQHEKSNKTVASNEDDEENFNF